jgi:hypothetical protein
MSTRGDTLGGITRNAGKNFVGPAPDSEGGFSVLLHPALAGFDPFSSSHLSSQLCSSVPTCIIMADSKAPSRWQQRREQRASMYAGSTEGAVSLQSRRRRHGGRDGPDASNVRCQNCLQMGHWSYQCRAEKAYASRPSRTKQMGMVRESIPMLPPDEMEAELAAMAAATRPNGDDKSAKKKKKRFD